MESLVQAESPLFRISEVTRRWRSVEALRGISFRIKRGEVVLLAGPSGAGKSTLLRVLVGGLKPTSGHVEVNGTDLASMTTAQLRAHQAACGIVEQGSLLVPQLSVHKNVIAGRLAQWRWHKILLSAFLPLERERVHALLKDVELSERQWEITANLSGGQQQRVAIARALISSPQIIIADEPIAALDARNAALATEIIVDIARKSGGTVIFCTHWVSLAIPFMDRFIGIREGTVHVDCKADEVTEDSLRKLYEGSQERL